MGHFYCQIFWCVRLQALWQSDLVCTHANIRKQISESDALEIDVKNNIVKNTTTHTEYKMRPFAPLIAKIIESGGLFKFDLNKWDANGTDTL